MVSYGWEEISCILDGDLPETRENGRQEDAKSVDGNRGGEEGSAKKVNEGVLEREHDPFLVKLLLSSKHEITLLSKTHGFLLLGVQEPS